MKLKSLNRFAFFVFFAFAFNFVAFAGLEDEENEKNEKNEKKKEKEIIASDNSSKMEKNEKERSEEDSILNYVPSFPSQNNQSSSQKLDNNGNFLVNEQQFFVDQNLATNPNLVPIEIVPLNKEHPCNFILIKTLSFLNKSMTDKTRIDDCMEIVSVLLNDRGIGFSENNKHKIKKEINEMEKTQDFGISKLLNKYYNIRPKHNPYIGTFIDEILLKNFEKGHFPFSSEMIGFVKKLDFEYKKQNEDLNHLIFLTPETTKEEDKQDNKKLIEFIKENKDNKWLIKNPLYSFNGDVHNCSGKISIKFSIKNENGQLVYLIKHPDQEGNFCVNSAFKYDESSLDKNSQSFFVKHDWPDEKTYMAGKDMCLDFIAKEDFALANKTIYIWLPGHKYKFWDNVMRNDIVPLEIKISFLDTFGQKIEGEDDYYFEPCLDASLVLLKISVPNNNEIRQVRLSEMNTPNECCRFYIVRIFIFE